MFKASNDLSVTGLFAGEALGVISRGERSFEYASLDIISSVPFHNTEIFSLRGFSSFEALWPDLKKIRSFSMKVCPFESNNLHAILGIKNTEVD